MKPHKVHLQVYILKNRERMLSAMQPAPAAATSVRRATAVVHVVLLSSRKQSLPSVVLRVGIFQIALIQVDPEELEPPALGCTTVSHWKKKQRHSNLYNNIMMRKSKIGDHVFGIKSGNGCCLIFLSLRSLSFLKVMQFCFNRTQSAPTTGCSSTTSSIGISS